MISHRRRNVQEREKEFNKSGALYSGIRGRRIFFFFFFGSGVKKSASSFIFSLSAAVEWHQRNLYILLPEKIHTRDMLG